MHVPGEQVRELFSTECEEFLICSPFIKVGPLEALLSCITDESAKVTIYTRWYAAEVAARVSDLEVFDVCNERAATSLYLVDSLHAKLFRAGTQCLAGSANVTDKALGWTYPSNIELLLPVEASEPLIMQLIDRLVLERRIATKLERDEVRRKADLLKTVEMPEALVAINDIRPTAKWIPRCRKPELIFRIYQSANLPNELESTLTGAADDLRFLNPPGGLSLGEFHQAIVEALRTHPLFSELLSLVERDELRNGVGRRLIEKYRNDSTDEFHAEHAWSNVREWLMYFFKLRAEPHEYRIVAGTQTKS